ncbi:MAG: hypothetical protein M1561_04855 [Gammaproteobacteria bacterium]|nr:hypothetical protein [Gammaproteobacteria bacterium]
MPKPNKRNTTHRRSLIELIWISLLLFNPAAMAEAPIIPRPIRPSQNRIEATPETNALQAIIPQRLSEFEAQQSISDVSERKTTFNVDSKSIISQLEVFDPDRRSIISRPQKIERGNDNVTNMMLKYNQLFDDIPWNEIIILSDKDWADKLEKFSRDGMLLLSRLLPKIINSVHGLALMLKLEAIFSFGDLLSSDALIAQRCRLFLNKAEEMAGYIFDFCIKGKKEKEAMPHILTIYTNRFLHLRNIAHKFGSKLSNSWEFTPPRAPKDNLRVVKLSDNTSREIVSSSNVPLIPFVCRSQTSGFLFIPKQAPSYLQNKNNPMTTYLNFDRSFMQGLPIGEECKRGDIDGVCFNINSLSNDKQNMIKVRASLFNQVLYLSFVFECAGKIKDLSTVDEVLKTYHPLSMFDAPMHAFCSVLPHFPASHADQILHYFALGWADHSPLGLQALAKEASDMGYLTVANTLNKAAEIEKKLALQHTATTEKQSELKQPESKSQSSASAGAVTPAAPAEPASSPGLFKRCARTAWSWVKSPFGVAIEVGAAALAVIYGCCSARSKPSKQGREVLAHAIDEHNEKKHRRRNEQSGSDAKNSAPDSKQEKKESEQKESKEQKNLNGGMKEEKKSSKEQLLVLTSWKDFRRQFSKFEQLLVINFVPPIRPECVTIRMMNAGDQRLRQLFNAFNQEKYFPKGKEGIVCDDENGVIRVLNPVKFSADTMRQVSGILCEAGELKDQKGGPSLSAAAMAPQHAVNRHLVSASMAAISCSSSAMLKAEMAQAEHGKKEGAQDKLRTLYNIAFPMFLTQNESEYAQERFTTEAKVTPKIVLEEIVKKRKAEREQEDEMRKHKQQLEQEKKKKLEQEEKQRLEQVNAQERKKKLKQSENRVRDKKGHREEKKEDKEAKEKSAAQSALDAQVANLRVSCTEALPQALTHNLPQIEGVDDKARSNAILSLIQRFARAWDTFRVFLVARSLSDQQEEKQDAFVQRIVDELCIRDSGISISIAGLARSLLMGNPGPALLKQLEAGMRVASASTSDSFLTLIQAQYLTSAIRLIRDQLNLHGAGLTKPIRQIFTSALKMFITLYDCHRGGFTKFLEMKSFFDNCQLLSAQMVMDPNSIDFSREEAQILKIITDENLNNLDKYSELLADDNHSQGYIPAQCQSFAIDVSSSVGVTQIEGMQRSVSEPLTSVASLSSASASFASLSASAGLSIFAPLVPQNLAPPASLPPSIAATTDVAHNALSAHSAAQLNSPHP